MTMRMGPILSFSFVLNQTHRCSPSAYSFRKNTVFLLKSGSSSEIILELFSAKQRKTSGYFFEIMFCQIVISADISHRAQRIEKETKD